jgi:hypothetical protein
LAGSDELCSLVLDITSEAGMDGWVAEGDTIQVEDLARFDPNVILVAPGGPANGSRPPFTAALEIRRDVRLADVPLVLVTDDWTLQVQAAEVMMVRPEGTLLMPFQLDHFIATVGQVCRPEPANRVAGGPSPTNTPG